MIEANNPKIDVEKLLAKVRAEVATRHKHQTKAEFKVSSPSQINTLANISFIEALLNSAKEKSQVRTELPKKIDRFPFNLRWCKKIALKLHEFVFKEQRSINLNLIDALRESTLVNKQLSEQVKALQAQVSNNGDRLVANNEQIHNISDRLITTDAQIHNISDRCAANDSQIRNISDRLTTADTQIHDISDRFTANNKFHMQENAYLKSDLSHQKRLITLFLEQASQRLSEPFNQQQLKTFSNEEVHWLDAFYVAFEDRFRGSQEDIYNRFKVYLPLIASANIGTQDAAILDVGCGRGEWLELLRESGYTAKGIDTNRVMLEQCQSRKLDVTEADVLTYLRSLTDCSLGMVTGFHIIEHLPFEVLIKVIDETVRVLRPQGLVIFETPNPANVLVGSCNFYHDPTHLKPLPKDLAQFILQARGLTQTQIIELHPYSEDFKVNGLEVAERFNDYFYGCQDYAVVGYKL